MIACLVSSAHAALTPLERRAAADVSGRVPAALALVERAVNQNSGTLNLAGVRATGAMFDSAFRATGFRTRWVDGAAWGRAGHLIAERDGARDAPRVLFIGHLDTVFEPDSPFQRFTRLDDSTATGPGTTDMKGGIGVMLVALGALADARALDRVSVRVVLTGDEEKPGAPIELARRDLVEAADWADVAIGFEDGDGDPRTAVVARRGSSSWLLRTSGVPYHSSQIFHPDVGVGAIFEAARILTAFRDSLAGEPFLTFNPGAIVGGTAVSFDRDSSRGTAFGKTNVVAESTVVAGDLRALAPEQLERARATMRRIVAAHAPRAGASIEFFDSYPPLPPAAGNRRLLAIVDAASRDLGHGPVVEVDPAKAGAADVSFAAGRVAMAIDGLGLMGSGGHTVRETADLRTFASQARRIAVTLLRLPARGALRH